MTNKIHVAKWNNDKLDLQIRRKYNKSVKSTTTTQSLNLFWMKYNSTEVLCQTSAKQTHK